MIRLISSKRALRILDHYASWIDVVSARYGVPVAAIKAILYQEMTQIDLMDLLADVVVRTGLFRKKDSSTGYGQIFGYVGLNAANFAVGCGLASYESLGIKSDHQLDGGDMHDVRYVWRLLHHSKRANIEISALNLLVCAYEMVGSIDFSAFSEHDWKLVFTRYNADVKHVTPYGEKAYRLYEGFGVKPRQP